MTTEGVIPSAAGSRVLAINAIANLGRAVSGSLVNLLLPLCLIGLLSRPSYSAWAVAFSVAAYVVYLDLGLQPAVQANVARWAGHGDHHGAARMGWSGTRMILLLNGLALVGLSTVALFLHEIFPSIAPAVLEQTRAALVLLVAGQGANVSINVLSSYYAGLQRVAFPATVTSVARAVSLAAVVVVGFLDKNLVALALAYAFPLLLGLGLLIISFRREMHRLGRDSHGPSLIIAGSRSGHLLRYSGPLIVWNICTLIVSGTGTAIVARVDFRSVVVFSIGTMFVLAVAGVDNAIMTPLLSELGHRASVSTKAQLGSTIIFASRLNSIVLSALVILSALMSGLIAEFGHFKSFGPSGILLVMALAASAAVRLTMTPLIMGFIATSSHGRVVVQPILEALMNLGLSIALGAAMGGVGVALGVLVSGAIGTFLSMTWSRRAAGFKDALSLNALFRSAIAPLLSSIPALIALSTWSIVSGPVHIVLLCVGAGLGLAWLWRRELPIDLRSTTKQLFIRLTHRAVRRSKA